MDKMRKMDMAWLRNTLEEEKNWRKSPGSLQRALPAIAIQSKLGGARHWLAKGFVHQET